MCAAIARASIRQRGLGHHESWSNPIRKVDGSSGDQRPRGVDSDRRRSGKRKSYLLCFLFHCVCNFFFLFSSAMVSHQPQINCRF